MYERDCYTCSCCGQVGGKLRAHHMLNYSSHPELGTDIENAITLCEKCHRDFHSMYGIKNNNRQQMADFLASKFREQKYLLERVEVS